MKEKIFPFLCALVGTVAALLGIIDFGWSENVATQNALIFAHTFKIDFIVLLVAILIVMNMYKFNIFQIKEKIKTSAGMTYIGIVCALLLFYGWMAKSTLEENLGIESAIIMAESGRFKEAAIRAKYLSGLDNYQAHKIELLQFEQSMISRDVLAKEYEKAFVAEIDSLSPQELAQRKLTGRTLIDPSNSLYKDN